MASYQASGMMLAQPWNQVLGLVNDAIDENDQAHFLGFYGAFGGASYTSDAQELLARVYVAPRWWIEDDLYVELRNLRTRSDGTSVVNATVTATLTEVSGAVVAPAVTLTHNQNKAGTYYGTITSAYTIDMLYGVPYYLNVQATRGVSTYYHRVRRTADFHPRRYRGATLTGEINTSQRLWIGGDFDVAWEGLRNNETGDYELNATVRVSIRNLDGTYVFGPFDMLLDYASTATYWTTIDAADLAGLTAGTDYYVVVTATAGTYTGHRRVRLRAAVRPDV